MVKLIETWGSDERVASVAALSYGKSEVKDVKKLINKLLKLGHTSVFEFAGATFYIETSIIVQRQWMRHRHLSYLEQSLRYVKSSESKFCIDQSRFKNEESAKIAMQAVNSSIEAYRQLLSNGVSAEVARSVLPLGFSTKFYASGNLRAWLHFLKLRLAANAQEEIRAEAIQVLELLRDKFPITIEAFENEEVAI